MIRIILWPGAAFFFVMKSPERQNWAARTLFPYPLAQGVLAQTLISAFGTLFATRFGSFLPPFRHFHEESHYL